MVKIRQMNLEMEEFIKNIPLGKLNEQKSVNAQDVLNISRRQSCTTEETLEGKRKEDFKCTSEVKEKLGRKCQS